MPVSYPIYVLVDKTFEEREALNANIVRAINEASEAWGLQCLRCEDVKGAGSRV